MCQAHDQDLAVFIEVPSRAIAGKSFLPPHFFADQGELLQRFDFSRKEVAQYLLYSLQRLGGKREFEMLESECINIGVLGLEPSIFQETTRALAQRILSFPACQREASKTSRQPTAQLARHWVESGVDGFRLATQLQRREGVVGLARPTMPTLQEATKCATLG